MASEPKPSSRTSTGERGSGFPQPQSPSSTPIDEGTTFHIHHRQPHLSQIHPHHPHQLPPHHDGQYPLSNQLSSGGHRFTHYQREVQTRVRALLQVRGALPLEDRFKWTDDDLMFRYLMSRKWDEEVASRGIEDYVSWRKKNNIDKIVEKQDFHPDILACTTGYSGQDIGGHPVYYDRPNPKKINKMLKHPREELVRYHVATIELGRALQRKAGTDRCVAVVDLKHIGLGILRNTSAVGVLKEFTQVDRKYYPENLKAMYVVNTPPGMTFIWNVVGHFLSEHTRRKVRFFRHVKDLEPYFPGGLEGIPSEFGGKKENAFLSVSTLLKDKSLWTL